MLTDYVRSRPPRPVSPELFWGRVHAALFGASGFLYFVADAMLRGVTGELTVATPLAGKLIVLALPAGALLYPLMRWRWGLPVLRRVAQAGWIAMLLAAAVYLVAGAEAFGSATIDPVRRAQIHSWDRKGRHGPYEIVFALQDDRLVTAWGAVPGGRNCYEVRQLNGANGFAWLRIVGRAPAPAAGQLNWPIDPADCFSASPLAELR